MRYNIILITPCIFVRCPRWKEHPLNTTDIKGQAFLPSCPSGPAWGTGLQTCLCCGHRNGDEQHWLHWESTPPAHGLEFWKWSALYVQVTNERIQSTVHLFCGPRKFWAAIWMLKEVSMAAVAPWTHWFSFLWTCYCLHIPGLFHIWDCLCFLTGEIPGKKEQAPGNRGWP